MNNFNKNIFLITGASGFIGSNLLRRLVEEDAQVHVILRKNSNLWRIKDILHKTHIHISDLSNYKDVLKIIQKSKPTVIYHLASYGAYPFQKNADKILKVNILGTWNLLHALLNHKYKLFVNTGSSSEYGYKSKPMKETDLLEPASYYAVSKCTQTHLCSHMAKESNKPIVTLRPFSVYGPYEEPSRFIPTLLKSLYYGKKMSLTSPDTARDFIYIDDMIDAYLKIEELRKYQGMCFNIGTGVQSTIKHVVKEASEVTNKKIQFEWGKMKPRSWDTTSWVADISLAKKLLKWKPQYNLNHGLLKNWEWFKNK